VPRKSAKTATAVIRLVLPPPAAAPKPAEAADFGREALATAMNSSAAFSAGVEAIGQEVAGYARASFENAGETVRALLAARTFEDVVRLQSALAKRNFDDLMERTAKLSELGCSLVTTSLGSWNKVAPR
jgi:hypothetical protein